MNEKEHRQQPVRRSAARRKKAAREKRRRIRRRRRLALTLACLLLLIFGLTKLIGLAISGIQSHTAGHAETEGSAEVQEETAADTPEPSLFVVTTSAGLNVRTGPDTTYARVATLSGGAILYADNKTSNWSQLAEGTYDDDWVCADYITSLQEENARGTVQRASTVLYGTPSISGEQRAQLVNGESVRILYSAEVSGVKWYEVQSSTSIGWIFADAVQKKALQAAE